MNRIEVKNLGGNSAEVILYGDIGGWGITAADVRRELDVITSPEITVRIHSYGGDGLEGIAIKNVLKDHPARVVAVVDGVAASAASLIAVAGADELVMSENSELMIHKAWLWPDASDADELRKIADRLDQVNLNFAEAYAAKAGGDPEYWLELMSVDTWFSAEEAVLAGLADRVASSAGVSSEVDVMARSSSRVFAKLKYAGRGESPAPRLVSARSGREGNGDMTFLNSVASRLGIKGSVDSSTVLAALDEVLAEQVETSAVEGQGEDSSAHVGSEGSVSDSSVPVTAAVEDTAEETVEPPEDEISPADQNGAVLIDKDVLEDLRRRAAIGDTYADEVNRREAEELVAAAIKDGKVLLAKRAELVSRAIEDLAGMRSYFVSLTPGLVPVAEKGRGGSDEARGIGVDGSPMKSSVQSSGGLFKAPAV